MAHGGVSLFLVQCILGGPLMCNDNSLKIGIRLYWMFLFIIYLNLLLQHFLEDATMSFHLPDLPLCSRWGYYRLLLINGNKLNHVIRKVTNSFDVNSVRDSV